MARTTSPAMRELMQRTGATQTQIERWQQYGYLPRFPRSYAGGGGSRSVLTDEIVERAQLLADYARPGALDHKPISLIASQTDPDIGLLREAVVEHLTAARRRRGMDVTAASPAEASRARLGVADRLGGDSPRFAELFALGHRDSDEEVDPGDVEAVVNDLLEVLKVRGTGMPHGISVTQLFPDQIEQVRDLIRNQVLAIPPYRQQCELVRTAPADQLVRACRAVPSSRRLQVAARASAQIALMRHAGTLTDDTFKGWHDLGMSYANSQRMMTHPMWVSWGHRIVNGAMHDVTDGEEIALGLYRPTLLDSREEYMNFLASLIPVHALHRMAFYQSQPGDRRTII
ncbi:hypothetical protein [Kitasatospora sp. NPDC089509]|uniref:hypothetical protein n=1 Tax=Kitasatospora sp. NPDC089509 TaxID=3364079 RepID=UPI0037FCC141